MRWLSLVLLASCAACQSLVIRNITVIDGTGAQPRAGQNLVITQGRIREIGAAVTAAGGAQVIDGTGKFLIPGLWDMHTHVAGITADPKWGKLLLPQYLAFGITSIRDMAGDVDALFTWEQELDEGRLKGPRMFIAGPFIDGSKQGFAYPTDVIEAGTPAEGRAAVRTLKTRGVNFIKVGSQLSRETFFAIADECKTREISFVGHVPDAVTPLEASNAGMKSEEHLLGIALAISSHEEALRKRIADARTHKDEQSYLSAVAEARATPDDHKARELFEAFNRNGTWITPTLAWTEITSTLSQQNDGSKLRYLPAELQEKWRPGNRIMSGEAQAYYAEKLQSDLHITALMHKAGVKLLAGSDSLDPWVLPGDSLHHELEMLVKAGLTPMEALQAATINPAEFFALQADAGTIEKGKQADMVLLDGNPIEGISNTRKVIAIIQRGRYTIAEDLLRVAQN